MTNSLIGDHQVAVSDVAGGPEGGKSLDFLKKYIATPREDTLQAPNSDMLPPPPLIKSGSLI